MSDDHPLQAFTDPRWEPGRPYIGTPLIKFLLIDPAERTVTSQVCSRLGAGKLFAEILGGEVEAEDMNATKPQRQRGIFSHHQIWRRKHPAADGQPFWFDLGRTPPRYVGRAIIVAQSSDRQRLVAARLDADDLLTRFILFDEPEPRQFSPEAVATWEAMKRDIDGFAERISADREAFLANFGGEDPSYLTLKLDARVWIGALFGIAEQLSTELRDEDDNPVSTSPVEEPRLSFFGRVYAQLITDGYLSDDMLTDETRWVIDAYDVDVWLA